MSSHSTLDQILADLRDRFGTRVQRLESVAANELHLESTLQSVAALAARTYRRWDGRLIGIFAEDMRASCQAFYVHYHFAVSAGFLLVRVAVLENEKVPSLTNAIPAANWQEREIQDMFGLALEGHPNPRRCALHDDWPDVHPLRKDFNLHTKFPAFHGDRHKFREVGGEGVFQVPVGPVHAGIIEPGHFLFSVAGEPVLYLQIRLFYTHKATEKLFEHVPIQHGVRLAESISGDSSFAHSTAFCHAIERAAGAEAPRRAKMFRTICLELERLYNHVADIGAIATDVAFVVANMHAMRIKEMLLRLNERLTGSRLLRGMNCLGGVRYDWAAEQCQAVEDTMDWLASEFEALVDLITASSSTRDRLETTGILTPEVARDLGVVGIAGRASGFIGDLRRDAPHASYGEVQFKVPVYREGDVLRRLQVRVDEVRESIAIIRQLLPRVEPGPLRTSIGPIPPDRCALGYTEGWRGEIFHWVRTAAGDRLSRCKIKDPSLQNWPALSEAILGNIVPDFPVVNKSFNLSYSGTDR